MHPRVRRVERAEALLEETLSAHPTGLPAIDLVDQLERWGLPEPEGLELLAELRAKGRLQVVRGHYVLDD